jgi:dienelactone hydrolase
VPVLARYPAGRGDQPLPVVVVCHGLGGDQHGYAALSGHLASHGYAVLHPQFLDSLPIARTALGLDGMTEQNWRTDKHARAAMLSMLFDPAHGRSRAARLRAVLASLAGQSVLPARLRPDQVIVAGHSFGAYTAQFVLGARLTGNGLDDVGQADPAVGGGLLMSPQGSGDRGLTARSWDAVTAPLLVLTGTRDLGPHGEGLTWRREPFDSARSRLRHLAVVRDGDHQLGGMPLPEAASPAAETAVRAALCAVAAAFADGLHGDQAALEWLGTGPFPAYLDHEHREVAA